MPRILQDFEGRQIRLTDERERHILAHAELSGHLAWIEQALAKPKTVIRSRSDEKASLYYRFYVGTGVGDKFICVVVKSDPSDAFVVTAYLTDRIKPGEKLWPK